MVKAKETSHEVAESKYGAVVGKRNRSTLR